MPALDAIQLHANQQVLKHEKELQINLANEQESCLRTRQNAVNNKFTKFSQTKNVQL